MEALKTEYSIAICSYILLQLAKIGAKMSLQFLIGNAIFPLACIIVSSSSDGNAHSYLDVDLNSVLVPVLCRRVT